MRYFAGKMKIGPSLNWNDYSNKHNTKMNPAIEQWRQGSNVQNGSLISLRKCFQKFKIQGKRLIYFVVLSLEAVLIQRIKGNWNRIYWDRSLSSRRRKYDRNICRKITFDLKFLIFFLIQNELFTATYFAGNM